MSTTTATVACSWAPDEEQYRSQVLRIVGLRMVLRICPTCLSSAVSFALRAP